MSEFSLSKHRTNVSILQLCSLTSTAGEVCFKQFEWLIHVTCMYEGSVKASKKLLFGELRVQNLAGHIWRPITG